MILTVILKKKKMKTNPKRPLTIVNTPHDNMAD